MTVLTEAGQFDQQIIDFSRDLAACQNTADIIVMYVTRYGAESFEAKNAMMGPYPVGFSRAQQMIRDLLAIIGRRDAELDRLRPLVPMACNECGKTVIRDQVTGKFEHYDQSPDHGTDITAGIAAGHPARA